MLDRVFNPASFEKNFSFEIESSMRKPNAEPFMVLLPPPNVTGSLHMGHALCYTIQDIIARYKRLKGYDVLFQPGLDHAGIVTQLLVEKNLYENGVEKGRLTREVLLKEIWFFKENSGNTILDQMRVLGISCDFARLRFTMDDESKKAVTKLFVQLFRDGLIYRGRRMVNWDPLIGSAISDLEIVEKEVDGNLWYIKYMFADSSDEYITVATTRPETLFGDAAVAVHPDDIRYKHLIGREVIVPLTERKIRIIGDKYADPAKGSGAVKITPAHDFNDYDVGVRNRLPVIEIMNFKGELNENVPEIFQLMDRFAAREKVVDLLTKKELLEKVEKIKQKIPFGDRSDVSLEPMITYQWFVNAEKLAISAIEAVETGKIKFIPKHWENLYFEWLKNVRPWCISRQIWWGHRIPAWYGPDGQIFVAETYDEALEQAIGFYGKNHVELAQDEDVLDTWFSSGMWPFVALGWPKQTDELKNFYSKMLVVTGFDIIFFWIARMIMMSIYTMGEIPFPDVYIHGLVRDDKGRKMSKSRGNVMNPLTLCRKYGADAVRYTLASLSSPGRDVRMNEQLIENGRNFLTKIWNVVRFAQMNGCVYNREFNMEGVASPVAKWIIHEVKQMIVNVENSMSNYRVDEVSHHIYHCVWDSFCDWYMEFIKPVLQQSPLRDDERQGYDLPLTILKKDLRDTTAWAIIQFLRVLYPICPFIVKKLSGEMGIIDMVWPDTSALELDFSEAIREVESLKTIISSVRSMKQCLRIPINEKINVSIEGYTPYIKDIVTNYEEVLNRMAGVALGEISSQTIPIVIEGAIIHLEVGSKIDISAERKRLLDELSKLGASKEAAFLRLSNDDFLSKATQDVIEEHERRVVVLNEKIQKIEYVLKSLEIV
ncbi:MAG: valine--tRNA ligase [Holosporaceae bacterium]|jgi:valyl-tRNA synthetase|nr:valine--tRNA ligase [Holosporaceae bacterium]